MVTLRYRLRTVQYFTRLVQYVLAGQVGIEGRIRRGNAETLKTRV